MRPREAAVSITGAEMQTEGPAQGPRILLIDDDSVFGIWVDQVLRRRGGFTVKHVLDPAEGLRRLETEPWDLLITDVELPGMTGRQLLDRARLLAPSLPVALVTAHETADPAVAELAPYAADILHKPTPADDFLSRVGALIQLRK